MRPLLAGRTSFRALINTLLCLGLLIAAAPVFSQSTADLLPVTEAYKLTSDASTPGVLKLHWTLAQDYYLYRGRMKFKAGPGVMLGEPQFPDGEKHHDEYLGDVEIYHHSIAGTTRLGLSVQYQGCHEVDPKICYPPHTEQLDLPLAAGADKSTDSAATSSNSSLGDALHALGGKSSAAGNGPLPPE